MNKEFIPYLIVLIHWVADFVFQDEKWATNKSNNVVALISHTITYSVIWLIPSFLLLGIKFGLCFVLITFIAHTITDYFTSKIVSNKFKQNKLGSSIPNLGAFSMIGLDQVMHYTQLFFTFYILNK